VLILDGSDVPKWGGHVVGVAARWCGATGKTDNCQAGVFLGYASRRGYTLLDRRLWVPKPWFTDAYQVRRRACRLLADRAFQTKAELAAAPVEGWHRRGALPATWRVCDEWFGPHQALLDRLAATGLRDLAEVPQNTHVWPLRELADSRRARARLGATPRRLGEGPPGDARAFPSRQSARAAGGASVSLTLTALPHRGRAERVVRRRVRRLARGRQP